MSSNEERLEVFTRMAEADPTNELAHFSLGRLYVEAGNLAAAEASLRRTLELSPQHSQAHRLLGETLLQAGRRDEAAEILRAGIQIAHERGEHQPRNQMQEALRRAGFDVPMPQASAPGREPLPDRGAPGEFVCRRCGKAQPKLEEAPFLNALGRQIQETICQVCWREWIAMSIKVVNEYRLNLLSPRGNEVYDSHMKEFLGLEDRSSSA